MNRAKSVIVIMTSRQCGISWYSFQLKAINDVFNLLSTTPSTVTSAVKRTRLTSRFFNAYVNRMLFRYYFDYGPWGNLAVNSSLNDQTWSVSPAAIAGVLDFHLCSNGL